MPKEQEFLRLNTIKDYLKNVKNFRSSGAAVDNLIKRFDSLIESTITEAINISIQNKRKTILVEDMNEAIENTVGAKRLSWENLLQEILLQNPTDLSKISKGVTKYIEQQKQKKKK